MKAVDRMQVRWATVADIPFLTKAIIEADKSGTPRSAYCSLLKVPEQELSAILSGIFELGVEGSEFGLSSFCVIDLSGRPIGACASWIEQIDGLPSWKGRMLCLREEAPAASFQSLMQKKDLVDRLVPARTPLSLQIESVFIEPEFRGRGLFDKMLDFHCSHAINALPDLQNVELIVYDNNDSALASYRRCGFEVIAKTKLDRKELIDIFPSDGMYLLSKKISK